MTAILEQLYLTDRATVTLAAHFAGTRHQRRRVTCSPPVHPLVTFAGMTVGTEFINEGDDVELPKAPPRVTLVHSTKLPIARPTPPAPDAAREAHVIFVATVTGVLAEYLDNLDVDADGSGVLIRYRSVVSERLHALALAVQVWPFVTPSRWGIARLSVFSRSRRQFSQFSYFVFSGPSCCW